MAARAGDTLVGGQYNATPPTLADGQLGAIELDANGNLKVVSSGTPSGTQAVSLASGAAASGAFASGALAAGSISNGADVVEGSLADANWASGSGTINAKLGTIATAALSTNPVQVYQSNSYVNITTQTTTVVKASPGTLIGIAINTPLATGVITIYDNTAGSGTKIATITQPAALLSSGPVFIPYSATCATGITIVTGTATQDITAIFR